MLPDYYLRHYLPIINCKLCGLHKFRRNIVWASIPVHESLWNGIMLVGEAPGVDEDKEGKPFVGKAGNVLSKCLEEAGIDRSKTYITNILKCRPPQNNIAHVESQLALEICPRQYLSEEVKFSGLKLIVALGKTAIFYFTGKSQVLAIKGMFWDGPEGYPKVLTTLHPSYVLRGGAERKALTEDLIKAREYVESNS